jgi:uncharacterized protein
VEITPAIPAGRQVIEAYGDGRFRIAATVYQGSVLVFPERTVTWPVASLAEVDSEELARSLAPVVEPGPQEGEGEPPVGPRPELLLIGCGRRIEPIPPKVVALLREAGVAVEAMDTGAACRTYNVLVGEDRWVAAALVAV